MHLGLPELNSPQNPVWQDSPTKDEHLHVTQKPEVNNGPWRTPLVIGAELVSS